jgi:hypothetical protein
VNQAVRDGDEETAGTLPAKEVVARDSALAIGKIPAAAALYHGARSAFESFAHEQLTSGGYEGLSVKSLNSTQDYYDREIYHRR